MWQAVEKMGLKAWFEQQLNPQSIDDSALDTMLEKFPAMQLSQEELLQKFPSPQMLRQMSRQGTPLPTDPVEHAIYADAIVELREAAGGGRRMSPPAEAGAGRRRGSWRE